MERNKGRFSVDQAKKEVNNGELKALTTAAELVVTNNTAREYMTAWLQAALDVCFQEFSKAAETDDAELFMVAAGRLNAAALSVQAIVTTCIEGLVHGNMSPEDAKDLQKVEVFIEPSLAASRVMRDAFFNACKNLPNVTVNGLGLGNKDKN